MFGVSGFLLALSLTPPYPPGDLRYGEFVFRAYAGLGATLAGAPLWRLIVENDSKPTGLDGVQVGIRVGLLAHQIM